jgi:peptidoglycan/LPS O-acetylase OafA/YrhL
MLISISNAGEATFFVGVVLLAAILLSSRVRTETTFFSHEVTAELKGLAILLIIFSHIGYFLVSDHSFLVPFSNYAGLGVDLFLLLSGYGIMTSALQRPLSIWQFYKLRLSKIYIPVAITVLLFTLLDAIFLHKLYPNTVVLKNMLGFFPSADLYNDVNSPLWFVTLLLAQYLLFSLFFWRRAPFLSGCAIVIVNLIFLHQNIPAYFGVSTSVVSLYRLHCIAFPLGLFFGALANQPVVLLQKIKSIILKKIFSEFVKKVFISIFFAGIAIVLGYTLTHASIGEGWKKEEATSLVSSIAVIILFISKKIRISLLGLFGKYSFEIYLLHWPLLYRYNIFYNIFPAGFATLAYLSTFLLLGFFYQKVTAGNLRSK